MMNQFPSAHLLAEIRSRGPLVHAITNTVVTNFTANVLLAVGAAPAMVDIVGESGMFAGIANGLLVNLGTPTPEQRLAAVEAAEGATQAQTPWVLDPVAVGALPLRTELARKLADMHPTVIRGNASEILGLAGASAGGRGVDATDSTCGAAEVAMQLAREKETVVAVSGPEDFITDGDRVIRVKNGDAMLTKITGGGCALGAVIAAFVAVRSTAIENQEVSVLDAVAAAHVVYGVCAEIAVGDGTTRVGPGTFAVNFLDALHAVTPEEVSAKERTFETTQLQVSK
ncbi:hydroxyethylthiazole kinase [Neomicrococcus lactis]